MARRSRGLYRTPCWNQREWRLSVGPRPFQLPSLGVSGWAGSHRIVSSEIHVVCQTRCHEPQGASYLAVQDLFRDLTACWSQGDGPVVGWVVTITFLEDRSHVYLPPVLWDFALMQWGLKEECECWGNFLCVVFQKPGWNTIWASGKFDSSFLTPSLVMVKLHFREWVSVHAREVWMVFCCEGTVELIVEQTSLYHLVTQSNTVGFQWKDSTTVTSLGFDEWVQLLGVLVAGYCVPDVRTVSFPTFMFHVFL